MAQTEPSSFTSQLMGEQAVVLDVPDLPSGPGVPSFLCLHASNVAAFCGRHKYKPQHEAFVEMAQRDAKLLKRIEEALDAEDLTYRPLLSTMDVSTTDFPDRTPTQIAAALLQQPDAVGDKARQCLKEAAPITPEDVAELRKKRPRMADVVAAARTTVAKSKAYQDVVTAQVLAPAKQAAADAAAQQVAAEVGGGLDLESKRRLEKEARSTWMKDRGTALEASAEEELVAACPDHCEVKAQVCVLLKVLVNGGKLRVHIPCRIDCLFVDPNQKRVDTVFEIKNRRNHFFVPGYDLDQLCLYVVGSQAAKGVLVERCQGEQRQSHVFTLKEARDRLDHAILPALGSALADFCAAVQRPMDTKAHWEMWQTMRATAHRGTPC